MTPRTTGWGVSRFAQVFARSYDQPQPPSVSRPPQQRHARLPPHPAQIAPPAGESQSLSPTAPASRVRPVTYGHQRQRDDQGRARRDDPHAGVASAGRSGGLRRPGASKRHAGTNHRSIASVGLGRTAHLALDGCRHAAKRCHARSRCP
jgi:hypothetical protein